MLAALLLAAGVLSAAPWTLVLTDGSTIQCDGAPLVVDEQYLYRTMDGKDGSIPVAQVDREKTGLANKIAPAHAPAAKAPQGKPPVVSGSGAGFRTIGEGEFTDQVLRSRSPVLVQFWASWCGVCRSFEPTFQAIVRENSGRLKVFRVDVDASPRLADMYGVQGVPTILLFDRGGLVNGFAGAPPKSAIDRLLSSIR